MKSACRAAFHWLLGLGWNPRHTGRALRALPLAWREYRRFRETCPPEWPAAFNFPSLTDRYEQSGAAKGAYFHQDLLVAQLIHARTPRRHLDVGSSVQGFVAHVASFRDIEVMDIRPLTPTVPRIRFVRHDLMQPPPPELAGAFDSVSCLHALEHFGLGRYGDPIDPDGWRKGLAHLVALMAPNGRLYLSLPIGPQRVEFNSHRVFAIRTVLDAAAPPGLALEEFHFVDDAGDLHRSTPVDEALLSNNAGCRMGCGIFEFSLN